MFNQFRSEKELFDETWLGEVPESRTLNLAGPEGPSRIRYWDSRPGSTGTALVLVHGLFDSKRVWRYVWTPLAARWRLVAPDLPGMGLSDKPRLRHLPRPQRYTPEWLAAMLGRTIDALDGLDDIVLVGHSYGGALALLALRDESFARRVRGLVLIAAAGYPQEFPPFVARFRGFFGAIRCCPLWYDRLTAWMIGRGHAAGPVRATHRLGVFDPDTIPREVLESAHKVVSSPGFPYASRYIARRLVPKDHAELVEQFKRIELPALVVWGRDDRIVPPGNAARFGRDLRHARVVMFDRCGHWPQLEKARETAHELEHFAEPLLGSDRPVGEKDSG